MKLGKIGSRRPSRAQPPPLALLEKAIGIAVEAHRGQRDRYGAAYILHPLRVMGRVETVQEKIVAMLHDVVEDTPWTFARLEGQGFPKEIIVAVDCLTKRPGESYQKRVARTAANPLARRVKAADLEDNMDIRRYGRVAAAERKRLAKYLAAWKTLTAGGR